MVKFNIYTVDAFTDQIFGGNAAGVVPKADGLTVEQMQNIAREMNLSETVFIFEPEDTEHDFVARYFTPTCEINFCGHATIALAWIMALEYDWLHKASQITIKTKVGIVPIEWRLKEKQLHSVVMTQVSPKTRDFDYDTGDICRLIGIEPADIEDKYPMKLAYTGNWHMLIPIKTCSAIDQASPLYEELGAYNFQLNVSTTHLFTFDRFDPKYDLYTRDFAPAAGIQEDPVTGAANGALAGYLLLENILDSHKNHKLIIAQGHKVGRPGVLTVDVIVEEGGPVIKVGGKAVVSMQGCINL